MPKVMKMKEKAFNSEGVFKLLPSTVLLSSQHSLMNKIAKMLVVNVSVTWYPVCEPGYEDSSQ